MKLMKYYLIIMLLMFLFFQTGIETYAMNTGFYLDELSEEDKNTFLSNVEISLFKDYPIKRSILCFDINEEGHIAIGQEVGTRKEICIYSSEGIFQYGYSFESGQSYGVEWDGDNLNICFVRSDVIVSVDKNGNILEIAKINDDIENNSYWNDILYREEIEIGITKYMLRNNMGVLNIFASSYTQLVEQKSTGEKILYDANSNQFANTIVISAISIIVFTLIVLIVSYNSNKSK